MSAVAVQRVIFEPALQRMAVSSYVYGKYTICECLLSISTYLWAILRWSAEKVPGYRLMVNRPVNGRVGYWLRQEDVEMVSFGT